MSGPMLDLGQNGEVLILAAAPAEARAVCDAFDASAPESDWVAAPLGPGVELVRTGVGKVNAAIAAARFVDSERHRAVLNVGVCGALPSPDGSPALAIGRVVVADVSVYADEGIVTPSGWRDMAGAGFPPGGRGLGGVESFPGMGVPADAQLRRSALQAFGASAAHGVIATVSSCSGTDAMAHEIAARTAGIAEGMEGAAVGHAVARVFGRSVAFLELRTVSNTTGDRDKQVWDLRGALAALTSALRTLSRP